MSTEQSQVWTDERIASEVYKQSQRSKGLTVLTVEDMLRELRDDLTAQLQAAQQRIAELESERKRLYREVYDLDPSWTGFKTQEETQP